MNCGKIWSSTQPCKAGPIAQQSRKLASWGSNVDTKMPKKDLAGGEFLLINGGEFLLINGLSQVVKEKKKSLAKNLIIK